MLLNDIWRTINVICLIGVGIALISDFAGIIPIVLFGALLGYVCKVIAEKKNRDGNWAFLYGFLWGAIAIIYYAVCEGTGKLKIK